MNKTNLSLTITGASIFLFFLVTPALAVSPNGVGRGNVVKENVVNNTPTATKPQTIVTTTLPKNSSCLARESALKIRMSQLTRLVITMESTFDKIAERVKTYYSTIIIPSGKLVSNYDSLVSDITSKKSLITTELNKVQADINTFNCVSGNPSTMMNQFRLDMQSVKSKLNDYRTSIKNLIVAVKPISEEVESKSTVTPKISPEK